MESLRVRFGTLAGVDRAAQEGDVVSIDVSVLIQKVEQSLQNSGIDLFSKIPIARWYSRSASANRCCSCTSAARAAISFATAT